MLEELLQHDKELFLLLNNLGNPTWDAFFMFITNKYSAIPLYLLLLFFSYKQFGLKKSVVLLITALLMIVVTNGLADFFKYGLQRLRPCYDTDVSELMRLVKNSCGGKFGYFSAHAANTSAIAFFFSKLLKQNLRHIGIFLMIWAILVSFSRVYIGVHFPLDVVSGMGIGLFFGGLFTKLYIFAVRKSSL
jgi:undecaprenyl-diphosphatase